MGWKDGKSRLNHEGRGKKKDYKKLLTRGTPTNKGRSHIKTEKPPLKGERGGGLNQTTGKVNPPGVLSPERK